MSAQSGKYLTDDKTKLQKDDIASLQTSDILNLEFATRKF